MSLVTYSIASLIDDPFDCDGQPIPGHFFCPIASGTCYTAGDGFVGCCSTTSCSSRTTCIDYTSKPTSSCNRDYGGCWTCTDSALPSCITNSNAYEDQYILYCGAVATTVVGEWVNLKTTGSLAVGEPRQYPMIASSTAMPPMQTQLPTLSMTGAFPTPTYWHDPGSSKVSGGAIAGISIGSAFGVFAIVAIVFYLLKRHKRSRKRDSSPSTITTSSTNPSSQMKQENFFMKNNYYTPKDSEKSNTFSPDTIGKRNSATATGAELPGSGEGTGLGISATELDTSLDALSPNRTIYDRQYRGLSVVNGMSPVIPSASTTDGRFSAQMRASAQQAAFEPGDRRMSDHQPDVAAETTASDHTPRPGEQVMSSGVQEPGPEVSSMNTSPATGTISPPSDTQSQSSGYVAYRPDVVSEPSEDLGRVTSGMSANWSGTNRQHFLSMEEEMARGWTSPS